MECPQCKSQLATPLLTLNDFPIYQHPVPMSAHVSPPLNIDIRYDICRDCGHAYQRGYDQSILENLYKQHYYTPRPSSLAKQFRDDFVAVLLRYFNSTEAGNTRSFMEIGCSSGEVLSDLKALYPDSTISGVEPNDETRDRAKIAGVEVYNGFWTEKFANDVPYKYDVIFSRHVIEHVFDFDDYIKACSKVAHDKTTMVVETPCLDWSVENASLAPFHVEHISLFSKKSLFQLLNKHGWFVQDAVVTSVGNMIVICDKSSETSITHESVVDSSHLQKHLDAQRADLRCHINGKKVVMWGAGSGGRGLMSFLDFSPEVVLDGNPNKLSRKFVGLDDLEIRNAKEWIEDHKNDSDQWLLIIASSYFNEIQQSLIELGWLGETISPYDRGMVF